MKLMLVSTLIISILGGRNIATAQNLVPNGSFEEYSSCPDFVGEINKANYWKLILNSPDFFSDCTINNQISVPNNFAGDQFPFDGHSYAGFVTIEPPNLYYREILGTKLSNALIPGKLYHVSMRVSRGHNASATIVTASNKIGIRFTTSAYPISNYSIINNYAQLYEDSVITDTNQWILLSWNYVPDSNYTHFYIGNFFDNAHTNIINYGSVSPSTAYYYLDSINIICNSENCLTGVESADKSSLVYITPNPSSESITISSLLKKEFKYGVIDIIGREITTGLAKGSIIIETSEWASGIYFFKIQINNQIIQKQLIIHH